VASTEVAPVRVTQNSLRLPAVGPRITSVLRDSRGNVWMAGALGLWRITGDAAQRVNLPSELSGAPVQAMAENERRPPSHGNSSARSVGAGRIATPRLAPGAGSRWAGRTPIRSRWCEMIKADCGSDTPSIAS